MKGSDLGHSQGSEAGEDFPFIPVIPKKTPALPTNRSEQIFHIVEMRQPEALLQTDVGLQDFAKALENSMNIIPDVPYGLADYKPQDPIATQNGFPHNPNLRLLIPEFFKKYDISTLAYIFFYFAGTAHQFFAGKELKKRGWIFHTQLNTWIRRLNEPIERTESYEIGKFELFEHSSAEAWKIVIVKEFKLEYQYLEE
jgi:CCR4-NOT transcription complex subunit 3